MVPARAVPPYLARLGVEGPTPADEGTLRRLVGRHVRSIPFENLDVQLGRPIELGLGHLVDKLVHARRGGYCFEQNALLAAVLGELGYAVTTLAARVRWNAVGPTPRTHMLLRVDLGDRPLLVDVGFGGFVPTEPLRLDARHPQTTDLGTFRLVDEGRFQVLQAAGTDGAFSDMYAFTDEPHTSVDYVAMNHFTSTHPSSRFRQHLVVARPTETERHALLDDEVIVRTREGTTRTKIPVDAVPGVLRERFGLEVADDVRFPALAAARPDPDTVPAVSPRARSART